MICKLPDGFGEAGFKFEIGTGVFSVPNDKYITYRGSEIDEGGMSEDFFGDTKPQSYLVYGRDFGIYDPQKSYSVKMIPNSGQSIDCTIEEWTETAIKFKTGGFQGAYGVSLLHSSLIYVLSVVIYSVW